jgi:hypothetical protein
VFVNVENFLVGLLVLGVLPAHAASFVVGVSVGPANSFTLIAGSGVAAAAALAVLLGTSPVAAELEKLSVVAELKLEELGSAAAALLVAISDAPAAALDELDEPGAVELLSVLVVDELLAVLGAAAISAAAELELLELDELFAAVELCASAAALRP